MTPTLAKSVASLIVSFMTFLGWSTPEYVHLLPKEIRLQISHIEVDKENSEENNPDSQITASSSTKTVEQKNVVENKTDKKTTKATPKPVAKTITTKILEKKDTAPVAVPKTETKTTPTVPSAPQPVYEPSPVQIKDIIKNEIKSIIEEIVPTKTESNVKEEKQKISVEQKVQKSVVNIYCSQTIGRQIKKSTGSGVMIDGSGVILTNAHVAEYFLLEQNGNGTSCYIRTESPAINTYKAKLVYFPEIWAKRNPGNISLQTLTGTGEYDYALLVITERVRNDAPNTPFVHLETESDGVKNNERVLVAGYPAGFSNVKVLESGLYSLVKPTTVNNSASFSGNGTDVIYTGATSVAEHGSSGGAVTDSDGNLVALIVATNIDSKSGGKNVQAITLSYIKKSIKDTSGKSLESLISNARTEATNFEKNIDTLADIVIGK